MDDDRVAAGLGERLDIPLGLDDHKMRLDRQLSNSPHRLSDRQTKADVRHKHAVHHVEMDTIGAAALDSLNLLAESEKIRG